ncbi:calmodulin-binding transcription activator 6-like [Dorcoceras hygrometricum]|uniref:Calmodulin-binding transcription activator 6-like n=1 Tax=Dorcoceras hygrometricum TaxID=472368 RepID=A0A2Z7CUH8_9LAMI|nr:calmodulin-binding transcription activator 6-like [Dorcoceras hygrometricum]
MGNADPNKTKAGNKYEVLTTRKQRSINKKAHPKVGNARRNLLPKTQQLRALVSAQNSKSSPIIQSPTEIDIYNLKYRRTDLSRKAKETDPSINTKDQNDDVQEPAFSASTKLAQNRFQRSIQRIKLNDIISPKTDPSIRAQLQNDGVLIKSDLTLKQQISAQLKQISALSNANKTTP